MRKQKIWCIPIKKIAKIIDKCRKEPTRAKFDVCISNKIQDLMIEYEYLE